MNNLSVNPLKTACVVQGKTVVMDSETYMRDMTAKLRDLMGYGEHKKAIIRYLANSTTKDIYIKSIQTCGADLAVIYKFVPSLEALGIFTKMKPPGRSHVLIWVNKERDQLLFRKVLGDTDPLQALLDSDPVNSGRVIYYLSITPNTTFSDYTAALRSGVEVSHASTVMADLVKYGYAYKLESDSDICRWRDQESQNALKKLDYSKVNTSGIQLVDALTYSIEEDEEPRNETFSVTPRVEKMSPDMLVGIPKVETKPGLVRLEKYKLDPLAVSVDGKNFRMTCRETLTKEEFDAVMLELERRIQKRQK